MPSSSVVQCFYWREITSGSASDRKATFHALEMRCCEIEQHQQNKSCVNKHLCTSNIFDLSIYISRKGLCENINVRQINILVLSQDSRHFADDMIKWKFWNHFHSHATKVWSKGSNWQYTTNTALGNCLGLNMRQVITRTYVDPIHCTFVLID